MKLEEQNSSQTRRIEQPLILRKRSDQNLNPIEEYDRDRIEREMMMPDIRYIH